MVSMVKRKPKISIVSLTSCKGCQFALFDLGEKFIDIMDGVEAVDFNVFKNKKNKGEMLDIGFVEGNPITDEHKKTLLSLRKKSKLLVVLGNCAAMGGIPEIKNYSNQKQTAINAYRYIQGIQDEPIQEIDNFVKVDFTFPGCPVTAKEFLIYFPLLLESAEIGTKLPVIPDRAVCADCKIKNNRCRLLDKKPCFGSMILGGCGAACPSSGMMCQGCRGLRSNDKFKNTCKAVREMMSEEDFENAAQIYGLLDDIKDREKQ